MSDVSISITMDEELLNSFRKLYAEVGLSMSAAMSRLARQAVNTNTIPAEEICSTCSTNR